MKLILSSKSPRRKSLLESAKIPFETRMVNVDESQITTRDPRHRVIDLSKFKSEHIPVNDSEVILTVDTVVSYQNQVFEKPKTKNDARHMIQTLSGATHTVYTGVHLKSKISSCTFVESTDVTFYPVDNQFIEQYINTTDPYDKAGAYGIQSLGMIFVKEIHGDYHTVVGLPLARLVQELQKFGVEPNLNI